MKFVLLITVIYAVFGSLATACSLDHLSEILAHYDLNSIDAFISLITGDEPSPDFLVEFGQKAIIKKRHDVLAHLCGKLGSSNIPGKLGAKSCLLQFALTQNDLKSVKILIAAGVPIDGSGLSYKTPLIWAVESGRSLEIIRFLIEAGADPRAVDDSGKIPCHKLNKIILIQGK